MTVPMNWDETAAGQLAQRAAFPGDDFYARREAAEQERRAARAEFEQQLAADPAWQADRQRQRDIADHIAGRGQVINVRSTIPPELAPLYMAEQAAQARTGTWGPGGATNDIAREMEQAARDRLLAAQLRAQAMNLPRGLEGL